MKPVHRRWLSLALTTTVWSLAARAAESPQPTPTHFGCRESTESSIGSRTEYLFQPTTMDALTAEQPLPVSATWTSLFAQERFRFRQLEFFVDAVPLGEPEPESGDSAPVTVRLVVHATGNRLDEWWRLTSLVRERLEAHRFEPWWDAPEGAATPGLPIFLFSWTRTSQGAGAACESTDRLILDFRAAAPSVPATLSCENCSYFGHSAWHTVHYQRKAFDCSWDPARADFLCTDTTYVPLGWAERAYKSDFLLLSGDETPSPTTPAQPADLGELARRLAAGTASLGVAASVPIDGPIVPLLRLPASARASARYLVAAAGHSDEFDARFIVVTLRAEGGAEIAEVPSSRLGDNLEIQSSSTARCPPGLEASTSLGPAPSFQAIEVGQGPDGLDVIKVVVRDGAARGVFLVGVEEQGGRLLADSLRLATDVSYYGGSDWRFPPQLAPIDARATPFRIVAEVEPRHIGGLQVMAGQRIEDGFFQPTTGIEEVGIDLAPRYGIYWAGESGFVLEPLGDPVPIRRAPRFVAIDPSGHVTLHTPQRR